MYLTGPVTLIFGTGNVICNILTSLFLFIFIEYQVNTFVKILIVDKISHYEVLKRKYKEDRENAMRRVTIKAEEERMIKFKKAKMIEE
jgi:hypothetical protein